MSFSICSLTASLSFSLAWTLSALLLLGQIVHGDLLDVGQGVLHAAGEAVLGDGLGAGGLNAGLDGRVDALGFQGGDLHDLAADLPAELLGVDAVAGLADQVHHIQGDDHGDADLHQLGGEVEVALQVGGVHDVQHHVGALIDQIVPGDDLLQRVGGEGIDARQVGHDDVLLVADAAFLFLNGDAGPVAHILLGTGQGVEQGRLAAVGVAGKRNANLFVHTAFLLYSSAKMNYSTSTISASALRRESSYPRTVTSTGSPSGATLRM